MIDFLKGTVGKDYFSDRLYGCQECIAEYLASKEPLHYCWHLAFKSKELFQGCKWWADMEVPTESLDMSSWNSITCYPRRTYYNIMSIASNIGSPLRVNRCNWIPKPTEMPSYPYEPGCESRMLVRDSLLTPGMDNTRHFYSITAVAGTVWYEPPISSPKPLLNAWAGRSFPFKRPFYEQRQLKTVHLEAPADEPM